MDAIYTQENRDAWQKIADTCKPQFPSRGKTVIVTSGKKQLGVTGVVTWHGVNKFYNIQYKTDAQLGLMDMRGREGSSVRIQPTTGEAFFVVAEYVTVVDEKTGEPVPSIHFEQGDMKALIEAAHAAGAKAVLPIQEKVNLILDLDREKEFDHNEIQSGRTYISRPEQKHPF